MSNSKSALRSILALLVVLLSFSATVPGRDAKIPQDGQQSLRKLEDRWLSDEHNPDALQSILADDFVHALPFGFISKQDQINHWKTTSAPPRTKHFEDMRVRVYGEVGIVNGIVVATAPDGSVEKTVFTDVFARRNGVWQAVNAQELPFQPRPDRKTP
jgi:hypothetical protein